MHSPELRQTCERANMCRWNGPRSIFAAKLGLPIPSYPDQRPVAGLLL